MLLTGLQRVLKVATVFTNTRPRSYNTPLSNSLLDASVVKVMPLFDKMQLEVVDTVDTGRVDSCLQHAPDFVVWWNESWCMPRQIAYSTVSRA